jgi:Na+/melibiose symporter-like transporter
VSATQAPVETGEPWWVAPARRRQTQQWRILGGYGVALIVFSFALLFLLHQRIPNHHLHAWQLLVPLWPGLLLVGESVCFLWLRRRGVGWVQPSPILGVKMRRRRQIMKSIRKDRLPTDEDLAIAIATCRHMLQNKVVVILFWISAGCFALAAIFSSHVWAFFLTLALLMAGLSLWLQLYRTRARRFLALTEGSAALGPDAP